MKEFKDLEFKDHSSIVNIPDSVLNGIMKKWKGSKQALVTFDNGIEMSVIFGSMFYSNGVDTYEAWCFEVDNEPRGYLSSREVSEYMIEVQNG